MAAKRKVSKNTSVILGVVDDKQTDATEAEIVVTMVTDKSVWYVCYGVSFIADKARFSPTVKVGDRAMITHSGTIGKSDFKIISVKNNG